MSQPTIQPHVSSIILDEAIYPRKGIDHRGQADGHIFQNHQGWI